MVEVLGIKSVKSLCSVLGYTQNAVEKVLEDHENFIELLELHDSGKIRDVINVIGTLRDCQSQLLKRLFFPKLVPTENSHGGIRGRSTKSNALVHAHARFVFKADISGFFPSIHRNKVYRLFIELGMAPNVARICTRLCTYNHHLAVGMITSPILADRILRPVDFRINAACQKCGLAYSRFVDDITISGRFPLDKSGASSTVEHIIREQGFSVNSVKHEFATVDVDCNITGVRIRGRGRIDIPREYAEGLQGHLTRAMDLARGKWVGGDYLTETQLRGKVGYVQWVSPHRKQEKKLLNSIDWQAHQRNARTLGLIATKKKLVPRKVNTSTLQSLASEIGNQDGSPSSML